MPITRTQKLLLLSDCGGANAARFLGLKGGVVALPSVGHLPIAHYPTYASKWNPIDGVEVEVALLTRSMPKILPTVSFSGPGYVHPDSRHVHRKSGLIASRETFRQG